jgi:hypothetical protein
MSEAMPQALRKMLNQPHPTNHPYSTASTPLPKHSYALHTCYDQAMQRWPKVHIQQLLHAASNYLLVWCP